MLLKNMPSTSNKQKKEIFKINEFIKLKYDDFWEFVTFRVSLRGTLTLRIYSSSAKKSD